jgi:RimJ/RimL family protein N-acetyltransferase
MVGLPELPAESALLIETGRLELRPITRADAETLFPILTDPALYEYTGDEPPASIHALRAIYAARETRRSPDGAELWLNWLLRDRASGDAIGYVQATVSATSADVAWVVGSRWWNQGFASEAGAAVVEWLRSQGVTEFRARIHRRHAASQWVAAKLGLRSTGELRDGEEVWSMNGRATR